MRISWELQHQLSPNQTFSQQKLGPRPSTILQILQTMCQSSFRVGLPLDYNNIGHIISKIQRLKNKFILLALRLPSHISVKLPHDSSGLPYVKDRLVSCATRTLEKISRNPFIEESITFNKVNPAWGRFPTLLSVICPVNL